MNRICLVGRLTKDVDLRYTTSQMAVANFSIAVTRNFKNSNGEYDSDFFNCKAFDKRAEIIGEHFGKGSQIGIEGHLQSGSYEKEDGTKVYTTDVIVDSIDFIGSKRTESTEETKVENDPFEDNFNEITLTDDDLPF